jgi:hypothetical protein
MTELVHEGGCLCGQVRFEARGAPANVRICHCRLCQKSMGSPFFARAIFALDRITVTGRTARYASSAKLQRVFCPTCGSRLMAERPEMNRAGIALALFDDPGALPPPECHFWTSSKAPWLTLNDGLPQYPEWPPD